MGIFDNIANNIALRVASLLDVRSKSIVETRAFREGRQKDQLRVRPGQFDDNLVVNFTGLVSDRTISQMFGTGIKLDFEGDDKTKSPQEEFVLACLRENKSEKLWHNAKQYAGEAGTGFFKVVENGVTGMDGKPYPHITTLAPEFVTIDTDPEDVDNVIRYTIEYKIDDKKVRREISEKQESGNWLIQSLLSVDGGKNFLPDRDDVTLEYCPIIHWQNLPLAGSAEGLPDIRDTDKEMQLRINFIVSNISKLIRLYGNPFRFIVNGVVQAMTDKDGNKVVDIGPDKMVSISGENSDIKQLAPLGDLAAAMEFLKWLKASYFSITRTVDIDSLSDKLGSLTNFALKVIYQDNESKINTMRLMMGEAIKELVMRIQVAGSIADPQPCEVVWPAFIPVDEKAQTELLQTQLDMGVLDTDTAISELGRDPEQVRQRIDADKARDKNNTLANVANFFRNG